MNDSTQPDPPSSGILAGGPPGGVVLGIGRDQMSIELKATYHHDPKVRGYDRHGSGLSRRCSAGMRTG